jgi:hypothetical protein
VEQLLKVSDLNYGMIREIKFTDILDYQIIIQLLQHQLQLKYQMNKQMLQFLVVFILML